jgi:hypothetical protein
MATNAFVAYKVTVTPVGHPKELRKLSSIDGAGTSFLRLAHGFLKDVQGSPLIDEAYKQYLTITDVIPQGSNVRFAGRYGHYGQAGSNVIDIQTGRAMHEFSDNDAFTTRVRNMIVVPDEASMGLLLCERYAGRGLATIYQREFTRAFRARFKGLTVHWEGLNAV